MTVEVAEKLIELRKLHGYSQEDLADKLGVSRQAVSKWERVEASPDTDNLIALAKLYGISLDQLLSTAKEPENNRESNKSSDVESATFIDDEGQSVSINNGAIHVKSDDGEVHINFKDGIHIDKKDIKDGVIQQKDKHDPIDDIINGITFLLAVAAYLVLGFVCDAWHPGWLVFFAAPVLAAIIRPKMWEGVFPITIVGVYLTVGFIWNAWHPGWIVFILIPVFYTIYNAIKVLIKRKHETIEDRKE